jgi:nicotinic acetylcholine receptor, invertebrate
MLKFLSYFFLISNLYLVNSNLSERNLKSFLLENYRTDTPPIINRTTLELRLGIALRSFTEINQMDGTLTTNIWLRHWWKDEYLTWEPNDWNNITSIVLFTNTDMGESIWVPDIYLYNTAENPLSELNYGRVKIYNSGDILWSRPGMIKSTCLFNLTSFPYDEQHCNMKFGSWSYHGDELNLNPEINAIDISELQQNQEWDLVNFSYQKNIKYYSCCPEPYPDITFNITLRRRPGFYNTNILLPAFATASLMILSLIVPSESGERIGFVTTVMLSIIVFLLILSENLPKSDTEPLLSRMLIGLTFFSLISVVVVVVSEAMRHYNKKKLSFLPGICLKKKPCYTEMEQEEQSQIEITNDKLMYRTKSYIQNVNGKKSLVLEETKNIEKKCEDDCEDYANLVEIIFMGVFTLVFIIYCIIMFSEKPIYIDDL